MNNEQEKRHVREHKKIKLGFMEIEKKTLARLKRKGLIEVGYDPEEAWGNHLCTGMHYHRPKGVVISNTCLSCPYRDQTDCNLCSDGEFLSCTPIKEVSVGKSLSDKERAKLREVLKIKPWLCPSCGWLSD